MAQQTINIGAAPDDGTGDTLRVGGDKINDNFTELYAADAALGTAAVLDIDIDDTLAADSDSLIPTQQAVKAYVDTAVAGAGGAIEVLDEGVTETSALVSLDFVGAGVVASDDGSGNVTVTVSGGGGAGVDIEDEGVAEATGATVLNFTGAGVTATDVGGGQVDIAIPGGGSGAAWTEIGVVSPSAVSEVTFTGLSSYNELLILARAVTASVSGIRLVQLSVDNGATYFSASGDYIRAAGDGGVANITGFGHATSSAVARTLFVHIHNLTGTVKYATFNNDINSSHGLFVASTSDVDAVRVTNSAGGTISGGPIYLMGR